ncbi:helix-turn-helix domain-containing protein [Streptomyces syringium]|uniref:helix-turn-helix domain-containing protein n=1 Tax=Streptomyces syringium TaxID=76729 RepID=UPI0034521191
MAIPQDLARLARYVTERRHELQLARTKAADAAGMSKDTWRRVETGQPVRDSKYAQIDRTLHWATGSCASVLEGGEPVTVEPSAAKAGVVISKVPVADLASEIQRAVESASIATTDNLSAAQIRALSAKVVDRLREQGVL